MATITSYLDFEIEIRKNTETNQKYRIRVQRSPYGGTPFSYFDLPFTEQQLKEFYEHHNIHRNASKAMNIKNFGQTLFETVFRGEVRGNFQLSLQKANNQKVGLRICLRLDDVPEIADLPWEYLYFQNNFLSLNKSTSLVRYLDLPRRPEAISIDFPLNILVAIANPNDQRQLDIGAEKKLIERALLSLIQEGLVTLDWLQPVTLEGLREKIFDNKYYILHFIGHGGFDEHRQEGYLLFEDRDGNSQQIFGEDLGNKLNDYEFLRLCILNSCDSGRVGSLAQKLTMIGIPAVIAMQAQIADKTAISFTEKLYNMLAKKYPVDAALTEARHQIHDSKNLPEWGTPVLYMRILDGNLFAKNEIEKPLEEKNSRSRRWFISTLAGVPVAALTGFTSGWLTRSKLPLVQWKLVSLFYDYPEGIILRTAPLRIQKKIAKITQGRFLIEISGPDKLVGTDEILHDVSSGSREIACGYSGIYYGDPKYRPLYFGCAVPFGLNPYEQTLWLNLKENPEDPESETFMQSIYRQIGLNIIPFPIAATGPQMGGWFKKEINSVEELENGSNVKIMRIPGLGAAVLERFGIENDKNSDIGTIHPKDIKDYLKAGTIQAAEWTGPHDDMVLGLHEADAPFYYYPGWWEPGTTFDIQVNRDAWEDLSPEYKEIFRLACHESYTEILSDYEHHNSIKLKELQEKEIKVLPFSKAILDEASLRTKDLLDTYYESSAKDDPFRLVYDRWKAFKRELYNWSALHNTVAQYSPMIFK